MVSFPFWLTTMPNTHQIQSMDHMPVCNELHEKKKRGDEFVNISIQPKVTGEMKNGKENK